MYILKSDDPLGFIIDIIYIGIYNVILILDYIFKYFSKSGPSSLFRQDIISE